MGGVPVMYAFTKAIDYASTKDIDKKIKSYIPFKADVIDDILTVLGLLVLPAYVSARVYLVVECFINLSHLPAGVYDVPS